MIDTIQLINKLTNAVSYNFKEDGTSPNITISKLRKGYYCSVVRFTKNAKTKKHGKVVVVSAKGDTLDQALNQVAISFLKAFQPERNPLLELADAMEEVETLDQALNKYNATMQSGIQADPFSNPEAQFSVR